VSVIISGGFTTTATGKLITILLPDLLPERLPPQYCILKIAKESLTNLCVKNVD
jgi:hypothetical protein